MKVRNKCLLAVLDPEGKNPRRPVVAQPMGSARSAGSGRPGGSITTSAGTPTSAGANAAGLRPPRGDWGKMDAEGAECSAFDLLHTEQGFVAFEQWYKRTFSSGTGQAASAAPRAELGLLWPQAFCPPGALHEYAFMELLKAFAECSDSEALDFFDILDCEFSGMLALPQVYLAMCLVAALGSRQLLKFLYFHSTRLFGVLKKGCPGVPGDRVAWPRIVLLLRLLGAPGWLISRVGEDAGICNPAIGDGLTYDEFLQVMFPVMVQLDRGTEVGESTVINESDRMVHVRSKMCAIL